MRGQVVVLGGTGFLGRHICRALTAGSWDVLCVAHRRAGPDVRRTVTLDLSGSYGDGLTALLQRERPVAVVNAAGAVWGATDEQLTELNASLVDRLIEVLAALPLPPRLVQIGSLHERSLPEPGHPEPAALYALTKARATRAVRAAAEAGLVEGVVLRVSNALGAGAPAGSLLGGVTERLAAAARRGETCALELPPLTAHRDFVDVRDVADAVVRAAARAPAGGRVIDVGRGESVGVRRLVDELIEVSGVRAEVTDRSPGTRAAAVRGRDVGDQRADIRAARELLGWRPRFTPHDALVSMWRAALGRAPRHGVEAVSTAPVHGGGLRSEAAPFPGRLQEETLHE
ncbi:NAD-dependent epimerase/dehydratase family protein [Streptomyces rishiriensis]|uniref:NAD-dependent epimerase/dehydratase family protein n=1 Tax=Streptomyces rishiriensis TaxID=68264 RepID=UPI00131F3A03|nr:NAD-dependent epimerase/dehydratase family protein [Streptomyces rishiriensis]